MHAAAKAEKGQEVRFEQRARKLGDHVKHTALFFQIQSVKCKELVVSTDTKHTCRGEKAHLAQRIATGCELLSAHVQAHYRR